MKWTAHPNPGTSGGAILSPITEGAKHGSLEWCPPKHRLMYFGGDASGKTGNPLAPADNNNNYRNEVWSLDVSTKPTWDLEQAYCTGQPGHRPHRPDWCGWPWDSKRKVFWYWPGENLPKPGTGGNYCNVNEFEPWLPLDPAWLPVLGTHRCPLLTYDPATKLYAATGAPLEKYLGSSARGWGAIYDEVDDQLVRVHYTNGSAGPLVAQHFNCAMPAGQDPWSYQHLKTPEYPLDMTDANIGRQRVFFDTVTRKLLGIDPTAKHDGKAYLYSYQVGTRKLKRECVIPVPDMMAASAPFGMDTQITLVGDSILRKAWWVVIANNLAAEAYGKKIVGGSFDGQWDDRTYNARDVLKVMECNLDTYAWTDITPTETVYQAGSPRNPQPYYNDARRLALTGGGAHGITVGYDPDHRLLVVMAGYASKDTYTLQMGVGVPVPVDCVLSEWSAWSVLNPTTEQRTRTVVTPPSNGGAPCGPLSETRPITPPEEPDMASAQTVYAKSLDATNEAAALAGVPNLPQQITDLTAQVATLQGEKAALQTKLTSAMALVDAAIAADTVDDAAEAARLQAAKAALQ